jgi:hypothetical protein
MFGMTFVPARKECDWFVLMGRCMSKWNQLWNGEDLGMSETYLVFSDLIRVYSMRHGFRFTRTTNMILYNVLEVLKEQFGAFRLDPVSRTHNQIIL